MTGEQIGLRRVEVDDDRGEAGNAEEMLRHRKGKPTPTAAVVVTGLDHEGRAVLAVPLVSAQDDLDAHQVLAAASTFGQARRHRLAAVLVEDWLEGYLEEQREHGHEAARGADGEPFSALTFFGQDNDWVWRPDARQATVDFLDEHADELAAELLEPDPLVRLGGVDNPPLVPAAARTQLEDGLRELGFQVHRWDGLSAYYNGVDVAFPQPPYDDTVPARGVEAGQ